MEITSKETAYEAGKLAAEEGVGTYDLTGEMNKRGIPAQFQGAWLTGVEDAMGHDPDEEAEQKAYR